uniref:CRAL-TRIO domain-containing protein n=1 Tax=Ascaris lumbricoides TaxID=6252 RepID=A0A0M3IKZ1_ASCLU
MMPTFTVDFFQTKDLLQPGYDTDYNILRWAQGLYIEIILLLQGYGFNLEEALLHLTRHLKFRLFFDLDNVDKIKDNKILKQYFPLGLVGKTGKNNHLLVVECAGRIDLFGILRSVQMSAFVYQRFKFQEMMLHEINRMEALNKVQCSSIYILDLDGLKLDTDLLSIVTGPYRLLWVLVYTNYPEWIDRLVIVNAPTYVSVLWKAITPLLPERTRNKVRFATTLEDTIRELQKCCDMKYVPKHWGGDLIDSNGDPMCRDRISIPTDSIPKELYWKPNDISPPYNQLDAIVISAGSWKLLTIKLGPCDRKPFLALNRYSERAYSMAVYHSADENAIDQSIDEMREWAPIFDYPSLPTVDYLKVPALGPGVYKFRFGNEQAWFRSVTLYYRIRFVDESDNPLPMEIIS